MNEQHENKVVVYRQAKRENIAGQSMMKTPTVLKNVKKREGCDKTDTLL